MDKLSLNFTIRYLTLVLGITLSAFSAVGYAWWNGWAVSLDSILKILALGVGATTATYAAMNLARIHAAHVETLQLKRKEFSAGLMERWLDSDMTKVILSTDSFVKEIAKLSENDAAELLNKNDEKRHACLSILNFFEEMATDIQYGLADEAMLKEFFRGVVITYHGTHKRIIEFRRGRANNPKIYKSFESLANKWGE